MSRIPVTNIIHVTRYFVYSAKDNFVVLSYLLCLSSSVSALDMYVTQHIHDSTNQ